MSTSRLRPSSVIGSLALVAGLAFLLLSGSSVARGVRHASYGAVLALVPEQSKIADRLRSLINRTRLAATEEEKRKEDILRLEKIKSSQRDKFEDLQKQLGDSRLVPAKALEELLPGSIPTNLLLDRGQSQGVGVQALAFTPDGLAGIVVLAEDDQSLVLLLTDQQCQIAARVDGAGETGMLCGLAPRQSTESGAPLLQLKYLSRYANPEPGTQVHSSGLGGLYPANLLLGTLVSFQAGDLYGEALVQPAVKFAEVETLLLTRASLP